MKYEQIVLDPKGIKGLCANAANISMTPKVMEERFGIKFTESCDTLDYFQGAVIKIDDTLYFLFCYYRDELHLTCLDVMMGEKEQRQKDFHKFIQTFGLVESDFEWIHFDLKIP